MKISLQIVPLGILAIALAMRIGSTPTANLSYLLLAAYAMMGRAQAIQALTLSWLFSMLSLGVAAEATQGAFGRSIVIAGSALSVFLRSDVFSGHVNLCRPVLATMSLGFFYVGHSFLFSSIADVSIFKAVSWTLVMATLVSAWKGLTADECDRLVRQIFIGLTILLFASLLLLAHPLGYLRNGHGFQGVLGHPQAFGPTMALLGTWASSHMFANRRPPWLSIGLVGACLVMVVLSETRTAGLGMVLGLAIAILAAPALSGQSLGQLVPGLRSKRVWLVLGLVMVAAIPLATRVADIGGRYIAKSGGAEVTGLVAAYEVSRGGLMDRMLINVEKKPFTGIGFGIASNPYEMVVVRDPFLDLPVSAATEKGVMPLAVLEEVGIIGFILTALWLVMLIRRGAKGGIPPLAITLTVLLLNMGESTFFSPGGMGMLSLVLMGWAFAAGNHKGRA